MQMWMWNSSVAHIYPICFFDNDTEGHHCHAWSMPTFRVVFLTLAFLFLLALIVWFCAVLPAPGGSPTYWKKWWICIVADADNLRHPGFHIIRNIIGLFRPIQNPISSEIQEDVHSQLVFPPHNDGICRFLPPTLSEVSHRKSNRREGLERVVGESKYLGSKLKAYGNPKYLKILIFNFHCSDSL